MRTRLGALLILVALACAMTAPSGVSAAGPLKALVVDGQNNHDWKGCQPVLKWILEESGRFTVDVSTTPAAAPTEPRAPKEPATDKQKADYDAAKAKYTTDKAEYDKTRDALWQAWRPKFSDYAVIVLNYNGEPWPEPVKQAFADYVRGGGGAVIVHAADNAFPEWPDYNLMIALGGWGNRDEKSGPMIRWRDGKFVEDMTPGAGGTHGPQHEFVLDTRAADHPIMKGLPASWRHVQDELYSKLRGPAKNMAVLATAFADPAKGGTGEHEPMLMTIAFGKGRVFHTALGHGPQAMTGLGFQVTLQRGAEWAATGAVTIPAPKAGELSVEKAAAKPMPTR